MIKRHIYNTIKHFMLKCLNNKCLFLYYIFNNYLLRYLKKNVLKGHCVP